MWFKNNRSRSGFVFLASALVLLFVEQQADAAGPVITALLSQMVVGDSFVIAGSGFTGGSVVNLFVSTASGAVKFGPFIPSVPGTTSLTIDVPDTVILGQGVVAVQVINTDEGYAQSNVLTTQLYGDPSDGFPNLTAIDSIDLSPTSVEPGFAVDNVERVVVPGLTVTLDGNGFDTANGVAVDLFCDCPPSGKITTIFLEPGDAGLSATQLSVVVPLGTPTGPGAFVVSNAGAAKDFAVKSNAVSVPIGAQITISGISQTGCTVTVNGTGFSTLTAMNLFNQQAGDTVVNLGGLNAGGSAKIPLDVVNATQFTFAVPGGLVSGPAYVEALNPPYVPFTSSGMSPDASFTAEACTIPAIESLNPSSAVAGGPGFQLTVNGSKFLSTATVEWNGKALPTTFISSSDLEASVPSSDITTIGSTLVTVSNPSSIGGGVSAVSTFFTGTTGGTGFAAVLINQQSNDLVYDPTHQAIYLSVPGGATSNPNTISVIDLATASIESSTFAGSEPNVLSISDDSHFLYAGIDGPASVRRFILPTLRTDITTSLGASSFFGPYFALDLQVAPDAPQTTAVTLAVSGESPAAEGGITIFDNAKARPTIAPGFGPGGGGGVLYDSLQWGSNDTELYAANNESTGFDFYTLSVNSSGVVLDDDYPSVFSSFSNRIHYDPGTNVVYSDNGPAIAPATGLPVGEFPTSGPMVPDSTLNPRFLRQRFVNDCAVIQSDRVLLNRVAPAFRRDWPTAPHCALGTKWPGLHYEQRAGVANRRKFRELNKFKADEVLLCKERGERSRNSS